MRKSLVVFSVCLSIGSIGVAAPQLSYEFTNSGKTWLPTDEIQIRMKVTNSGADELSAGAYGSTAGLTLPPAVSAQYDMAWPTSLAKLWESGPNFSAIASGGSVEWTFATLTPWPLTGNLGDPVPVGTYSIPASEFEVGLTLFASNLTNTGPTKDFVWTVAELDLPPSSVPLTGTLGLLALGAGALAALRRRFAR